MKTNGIITYCLLLAVLLLATTPVVAQQPLYVVNGQPRENIDSIPPEVIEQVESLPADEETIALYGEKASNGVLLITLTYDQPARFPHGESFNDYVAAHVEWGDDEPAARVILRYRITEEGRTLITQELESTDNRLKRRVVKTAEESPLWHPATKEGRPVTYEGVLHVQLPKGKYLRPPVELVYR